MNYKRNFKIKIIIPAVVVCLLLSWLPACSGTINESINPESKNNSITTDADSSIVGNIELGFCKKVIALDNHTGDIALDGDIAYAADGYNGIKKISIKDMNAPEIIGGIKTSGFARSLYISGKYLYIADGKFFTISEKF